LRRSCFRLIEEPDAPESLSVLGSHKVIVVVFRAIRSYAHLVFYAVTVLAEKPHTLANVADSVELAGAVPLDVLTVEQEV